jgi:hypothetical protein
VAVARMLCALPGAGELTESVLWLLAGALAHAASIRLPVFPAEIGYRDFHGARANTNLQNRLNRVSGQPNEEDCPGIVCTEALA